MHWCLSDVYSPFSHSDVPFSPVDVPFHSVDIVLDATVVKN